MSGNPDISYSYRPVIGLTCSLWAQKEEWIHQEGRSFDHLKREYYQLIEARGGIPLLLPNVEQTDTLQAFLDLIDGLLLSGGDDVDPIFYNEPNRYTRSIIHPQRDLVELTLAQAAAKRFMPVLGICRGIQTLNVAFGGNLWQDTSLRPGTQAHASGTPFEPLFHDVTLHAGTELARVLDTDRLRVTSVHHQHLKDLAPGFVASATAPDGIIEGIEIIDESQFLLGVQWHPESEPGQLASQKLLDAFIQRAANYHRR